jgi:predicted enzyme related to lactoylglutathione lyase
MKKVTGIGGIFFKSENPEKIKQWYKKHLGLDTNEYGAGFQWLEADDPTKKGFTQWNPFARDTDYFDPSKKDYMINYRVHNLESLVEELRNQGIEIIGEIQIYPYGKFAHIMDPEGNKIELWEPDDSFGE